MLVILPGSLTRELPGLPTQTLLVLNVMTGIPTLPLMMTYTVQGTIQATVSGSDPLVFQQ
jgi:hypothetical protein